MASTLEKPAKPRRKSAGTSVAPTIPTPAAGVDAAALRSRYGLPRRTFARVLGVSERTLAALEADGKRGGAGEGGRAATESVRRRLAEADRLHRGLSTVIKPDALPAWLDTPNDAFGGLKPIELIERGESDRLWRMLFELRSGNPF